MSLNQQQFKIWHDQYRPRLLNSMTALVRNRDTAEDVTAAALATAWQHRDQFRGESSLYTWLYSIALNEARSRLRRNLGASLESIDNPDSQEPSEPDTLMEALERSESRSKLAKALGRLGPAHRRALVSHFVHGHPIRQIAQQERVPVGTILSRIFTGKRLLRAAWEA